MKAKYTANWKFFRTWTEEMAYTLGFLFADGNISPEMRTIQVSVKESDQSILESIKSVMNAEHPINIYERKSGFSGENLATLHLINEDLIIDAMSLGLIPRKTRNMPFPEIPCGYERHFVRGFFDGDGSVTEYTDENSRPGFVGLRTFFICHDRNYLQNLGDLLKDQIGIIPKIYKLGNSWRLQYGGRESIALYDWMYYPLPGQFLPRKKNIFENWLDKKGVRTTYKRRCKSCRTPFVRISGLNEFCKECKKTCKKRHQERVCSY